MTELELTYSKARELTEFHYENFPVASFLIPKHLRDDVAIIYWFARTADNIADEEVMTDQKRIELLNEFETSLLKIKDGRYECDFFEALATTINRRNLSLELFSDLLSSFRQDVTKKRYNNFNEVLDYCSRSANPIGRLILQLFGIKDEEAFYYSDKICTALQLTNFYQDTNGDYKIGRIYFPLDELVKYEIPENQFENSKINDNFRSLVRYNVERTGVLFEEGKLLYRFLNGRLKLEIKWTVAGGEKILEKIRDNNYDVLNFRPVLTKKDFLMIFIRSLFK